MSLYAHTSNGRVIEFKEIDDSLYTMWVSTNNPKKDYYSLVVFAERPQVEQNEVAEQSFVVNENTVNQVWTVRNKNANELRQIWTAYEFLLRFTPQERAAFRAAALTDPNVADFQQLAQAAQEVVSDDPMTIAGMNYLVYKELLTEERKNEILNYE